MKWSQLKNRIEETFADSIRGRVEVWNTRYRESHDGEGEAWITIDKERVFSMACYTYLMREYEEEKRLQSEKGCTDYKDPDQAEGYYDACDEAQENMKKEGIFSLWETNGSLFNYLNLSIENAISSENPIIRAFATLDRRFGKRRLKEFNWQKEHPLVKILYKFRCEAENIKVKPEQIV